LMLFLKGVTIFLLCSGSPSPSCPIHIKEEFSVSALRHSQHCCKFQVSICILPLFFIWLFLAAPPEVSLNFLSYDLYESVG
jgi:hypothetical protein